MRSTSKRFHRGQIIADRVKVAADAEVGPLKGFRNTDKVQGERLIGISPPLVSE